MKIAALKIQQKKLGLSDVRYRDLLLKNGRVSSSKELTPSAAKKVYSAMCQMAEASTPAARYVWVLWTQLQPHLSTKERHGAYLAGWIRRCCPESDLSDLSDQTPAVLHKVIESLNVFKKQATAFLLSNKSFQCDSYFSFKKRDIF